MEHLMESRSGEQTARDTASQAEQILSLLERRGLVEDPSIINPKARETEQELRRNMYHNTKIMPSASSICIPTTQPSSFLRTRRSPACGSSRPARMGRPWTA